MTYAAERYRELRAAGLCAYCKTESPNRTYCTPCYDKYRGKYREARAKWARERKERLVAEGTCYRCAKRPADVTRTCKVCRPLIIAANNRARRGPQMRVMTCSICGAAGHNKRACSKRYTFDIQENMCGPARNKSGE